MATLGSWYYRLSATRLGHRLAYAAVSTVRACGAAQGFKMPLDCLSLPHEAVAPLMRLWRRMHWSSGDGMMPPDELLAMYKLAFNACVDGDFVELGAWKGLTTCYLATACRQRGRGRVFAVDTFEGTREHETRYASITNAGGTTLPDFEASIRGVGMDHLVTPCSGYTTEVVKAHQNRRIAFLLIDADHSYEGVKADFESWFPLVTLGGTVVFHDYTMRDGGVGAYVDREVIGRTDVRKHPFATPANVFALIKTEPASPPARKHTDQGVRRVRPTKLAVSAAN
jgi:cephalosporin hydroxylase